MAFLLFIARIIFGTVFIISGFFKLTDPIGTGLIITEYLNAAHVGFFAFASIPVGIILSVTEFITGISILMRLRMRFFSWVGLVLTCFFTLLTLILALFNPIQDCGCFGEAIHLTNWQTFYKNIILLLCIVPIYLYRKKFRRVAPAMAERTFIGCFALIALTSSLISYFTMPFIEFGDFRTGTNISIKLDDNEVEKEFNTVFTYRKEDVFKEFTLDDLPDSTWTFVDSKTSSSSYFNELPFSFDVRNVRGDYITDSIVNSHKPQILMVISDISRFTHKGRWKKVSSIIDSVRFHGGDANFLTTGYDEDVKNAIDRDSTLADHVLFADYKTLISLCRSNGGVVYLNDGMIVKKWYRSGVSARKVGEVIREDPDEVAARVKISQQLFYELSILFVFISIILFRYVCGIIYGKKPNLF